MNKKNRNCIIMLKINKEIRKEKNFSRLGRDGSFCMFKTENR